MKTIKDAIAVYHELSTRDRITFYITLSNTMSSLTEPDSYIMETRYSHGIRCTHCDSSHYVKNGHRKDGRQRYLCRDCRRSFLATTNSLLEGTHKRMSVWARYLDCMMERMTLRETSEVCGISVTTAFNWRHKILDSLCRTENCIHLGGKVEADETYLPVSFKGNHNRSSRFIMPRKPHKRGHAIHKSGLSFEQVCIPCAVDRAGVPVSGVGKLGKVSSSCIEQFFRERLHSDTVLCTDQEKAYRNFAKNSGLTLIQMETDHHINGSYGIQRINAYHSKLKKFLHHWNGVATKYLPNYLAWHDLMFCSPCDHHKLKEQLFGAVLSERIRIRCSDIAGRPAIPIPL